MTNGLRKDKDQYKFRDLARLWRIYREANPPGSSTKTAFLHFAAGTPDEVVTRWFDDAARCLETAWTPGARLESWLIRSRQELKRYAGFDHSARLKPPRYDIARLWKAFWSVEYQGDAITEPFLHFPAATPVATVMDWFQLVHRTLDDSETPRIRIEAVDGTKRLTLVPQGRNVHVAHDRVSIDGIRVPELDGMRITRIDTPYGRVVTEANARLNAEINGIRHATIDVSWRTAPNPEYHTTNP